MRLLFESCALIRATSALARPQQKHLPATLQLATKSRVQKIKVESNYCATVKIFTRNSFHAVRPLWRREQKRKHGIVNEPNEGTPYARCRQLRVGR
jgi:hypothetical protein